MDDFPMDDLIQTLQQYPRLEALHLIIQDVFSYQRVFFFYASLSHFHWCGVLYISDS